MSPRGPLRFVPFHFAVEKRPKLVLGLRFPAELAGFKDTSNLVLRCSTKEQRNGKSPLERSGLSYNRKVHSTPESLSNLLIELRGTFQTDVIYWGRELPRIIFRNRDLGKVTLVRHVRSLTLLAMKRSSFPCSCSSMKRSSLACSYSSMSFHLSFLSSTHPQAPSSRLHQHLDGHLVVSELEG